MYLLRLDLSRIKTRIGSALLVFSLLMIMGCWFIYDHYVQALKENAHEAASRTVSLLEEMLDRAEKANNEVLPLLQAPCAQKLPILRKQVAMGAFLRSINLGHDGFLNCSSLLGEDTDIDEPRAYSGGKLRLMSGNKVQTTHPLLVVRAEQGKYFVLSVIDSIQIRFLLSIGEESAELFLQVGSAWLDKTGRYLTTLPPLHDATSSTLSSTHYPFIIHAGYGIPTYWQSVWEGRRWSLLLLTATSLSLSLLVWWVLGRPGSLSDELRRALRAKEFVPYLQTLVTSHDGRMMGAEVLMRWQHATEGVIRPDLFIPQAEESGLIVPMTSQIMRSVATHLSQFQALLPDGFHIGFNISAAHCNDLSLLSECRDFLDHFMPNKVMLVLELTERKLLMVNSQTLSLFRQLNEMGVQLAIDDFGTGHSNLVYLQQFHVNYLKIDQSFIARIGTEALSEHIVDNVIDLATRLGLSLVAEGVEKELQAEYLRDKGVNYLQGFLYASPIPLRQFCEDELPGRA